MPVSEDPRRLATRERTKEDRDDARLAVGVLARSVHVSVAKRDVGRPVQAVERAEVLLASELGSAVRRHRAERGILGYRLVALSVDRTPGRAEHDLRSDP